MNNTYIFTTIKEISTNINEILSTIKETPITFPQIIINTSEIKENEETNVDLLGFNQLDLSIKYFSLYMYLISIKNNLYSNQIQYPITITNDRNIRRLLKESIANCTLVSIQSAIKYKYYCRVNEEATNIKGIKIELDFDFVNQENAKLKSVSPLANMFINNMLTMKYHEEYNNIIENSRVYIMDNSKIIGNNKLFFNISGRIIEPKPKLDNKNIMLMINSENDENPQIQVQCDISNITSNNYVLYCKSNETFKGELQSALSFIDNKDILLLNFADINESFINLENIQNYSRFFIKNDSKSLGPGAIAAIIIPVIVAIALITFLIFYLNKKNRKVNGDSDSSIRKLKISDGVKNY